jgi:flagellar protein FliO/FliZ
MPSWINYLLIFIVAVALIIGIAWLVRRFGGNKLGASANRGRLPRLAVVDAADFDGRRKLVLVRRDNVEHLLLVGGPTDIVIEPNIVRAAPQREQGSQRSPLTSDAPGRAPDLGNWTDGDSTLRTDALEPYEIPASPEPPPLRPSRSSQSDEARRPVLPPMPERRSVDPLAGFSPESSLRPEPTRSEPRIEPPPARPDIPNRPLRNDSMRTDPVRSEPLMPRPPRMTEPSPRPPRLPERAAPPAAAPSPAPAASAADQNLAEMAQRLEAALRRPSDNGDIQNGAPSVAPDAPLARPPRSPSVPLPSDAAPRQGKDAFENLEDEMASLLGRSKPPA